jgi:hypothetical protein
MGKLKKSIIDSHPQSEDVKIYIYTERFEGTGFRLISEGLHDLFDIKISHTGVANWLKLNPPPAKHEPIEEQLQVLDIFDSELYKEILPNDATEIEKIKAKYYTLIQCNLDRHVSTGKRLNSDYIKHLKTVLEVARLEFQVQREMQSIENENKKIEIELVTKRREPNFDNFTNEELDQFIALVEKMEYYEEYEMHEKFDAINQHRHKFNE